MAGKLMHALQYSRYGGGAAALMYVEIPIPEPKDDEVLVKVEAASLNAFDRRIQNGVARPFLPRKFPYIPGTDVSGEVVKRGSSVKKFQNGDKVVAVLSHATGGALAEYAVAKESLTVAKPPELPAPEAAALPIAALTAYGALTQVAKVELDQTSDKKKNILITAASGGVGHYAVQVAKLGNAHVTTTCGARNMDFVRSLGADEVLDCRTPEGAALKSPSGKKYDYVIHCATGIPWSVFEPNLSDTGKVIDLTPGPSAWITAALKKLTFSKKQLVPYLLSPKAETLECVVSLVKQQKVKSVIDSKSPLSQAHDAWTKMLEGHATGKIIIEP